MGQIYVMELEKSCFKKIYLRKIEAIFEHTSAC